MTLALSQNDINNFIGQGYTMEEIQQAVQQLEQENPLMASYNKTMQNTLPTSSNTLVSSGYGQDNLIKWQLELDSILERIEHILRGDRPTMVDGNLIFLPAKDDKEKIFNDLGVSEIMRILSIYLNRNTILSNYDEDTIKWKVLDFGNEISDLIFLKYEALGLDTLEKRKRYPMIIREIIDTVHSAYLRALNGGERDSLRQARQIHQTETFGQGQMPHSSGIVKERSIFNPMRFLAGKYGRVGI